MLASFILCGVNTAIVLPELLPQYKWQMYYLRQLLNDIIMYHSNIICLFSVECIVYNVYYCSYNPARYLI